jgi:hypothetical protein
LLDPTPSPLLRIDLFLDFDSLLLSDLCLKLYRTTLHLLFTMDELPRPSWMDRENDDSHKAEVEPLLFGTGNLSLHDEDNNHKDQGVDVEQQFGKKADYGAVLTEDSDAEDEGEHEVEHTVITSATSASGSSKQSSKSGKGATKKKAKTKVRQIVITESGKPEIPRPSCLMATFHFIESLGVITCLALMGSQALPLIAVPWQELGVANTCLKVYIALFCVLFVMVEGDVPIRFLRDASFLQSYVRI